MGEELSREEIMEFARDIRRNWGRNPFRIAEICGIKVTESDAKVPSGTTICMPGYPTIISIFGARTEAARRVLCAHELGHALLHSEKTINRFNGTSDGVQSRCEYEANLFAVMLLFDENEFNRPVSDMDNWMLKAVLDYNL